MVQDTKKEETVALQVQKESFWKTHLLHSVAKVTKVQIDSTSSSPLLSGRPPVEKIPLPFSPEGKFAETPSTKELRTSFKGRLR